MDDKQQRAVVSATQAAGKYLRGSPGVKKTPYEMEKRARDIMMRELRAIAPQISMWGDAGADETAFTVCPLDSQGNFERGIGTYGVMASLIEGGTPIFGAIFLPESEETLTAERGKGARLNGKRVEAGGKGRLSRALVCCGCNIYNEEMKPLSFGAIEALARNAVIWRNMGSPAAEFVWLATGKIDGIVIPMLESAHSAGYLAIQEAGAIVTDKEGKPFSLHSASIIAANPNIHQDLYELVRDSL
ncbi:inositol monophosphatase family protein [Candidatus Micrarchaeota archaeon]|nr:inositol monophosphatase family protein [Candidatus Micrarchaeota archaeon]